MNEKTYLMCCQLKPRAKIDKPSTPPVELTMMKTGTLNISVVDPNGYQISSRTFEDPKEGKLSKKDKIIYSFVHMIIHLTFGITLSSMSPAFVDFRNLLNTEMEWIGLFPTFQGIGCLLGSCVTVLFKWINRQITLSILVMGMGLSTIFMPYATQLWHLYACIFVYGLGIGAWNGANNVILIEMWQHRSPSILQASQFIYGIGTVLGPLLASSFVLGDMICPGVWPSDCFGSNSTLANITSVNATIGPLIECTQDCLTYDRRPQLKIPYLIGGLLMMIGPVIMLVMYCIKKYSYINDGKIEVATTPESKARHKKYVPVKTILFCISLFFAFGIMSENMYTDFAPTFFQFQPTLRLSAEIASEIFGTMSIALSTGRGLSVFIAMYLKPQYMISYQLFFIFFGYIFQIIGQDNLIMLWASAVIICFGYSSIFICMFSFVGQYIEMTDKVGGLFIGAYNSIYLFLPYFISKYIEDYPTYYLYLELGSLVIGMAAFFLAYFSVRNVPKDCIRKLGPIGGH